MCEIKAKLRQIRNEQREAVFHAERWEIEELHMHLTIETEKLLRRHEARCPECSADNMN